MKKSKIIIAIYILILTVSLCGCSNKKNNNEIDKKIESEIEYLNKQIIGIMNKLNNITLENYEVESKKIISQKETDSKVNKETTNNGSDSESSDSESEKGESEGSQTGSNSGNIKVLQMQPSNILVIDKNDVDWVTIKSEAETMYSSWNTILLDLYSINISNDDIINFSKSLDSTILAIKSEDKSLSLQNLSNLYSFLPKYANNLSIEESKKNILQTKANILNAYALVEQSNWQEVENQLNQADIAYTKVTNDVSYIQNKQEQVERVYVLIKELKSSIYTKDKDIFYIKYKNLMNSIEQ
mgnify:FL=1